jgi:hypothetical protein
VVALAGPVCVACAGTTPQAGLNPADYAWCDASGEICTGWRGEGPFIAGATGPVGSWVMPASEADRPRFGFVPGAPIATGVAFDWY